MTNTGLARETDSTIAPPQKPAIIFFNERFMVMVHGFSTQGRITTFEKTVSISIFLVCKKVQRSMTSRRVSRDTVFQETRPGTWFF